MESNNEVTIVYSENLISYPRLNLANDLVTRHFIENGEIPPEIADNNWNVIFVAGWHIKPLRKFLRQRSDVIRIMYTDTQNKNSFKYFVYSKLMRAARRFYFDGALVPGIRQIEFVRRLGFSSEISSVGGISYDDSVFKRDLVKSVERNGPFLFVGRVSTEKNIHNLCLAYNLYRQASTNPRDLEIIGPIGNYSPVSNEGVRILGYRDSIAIATSLNSCKAFLFPSIREPFGISLLEAGACGSPMLTSPYVGAGDYLITENTGFIVDPEDVTEICNKLLEFDEWSPAKIQRASETSESMSLYFSPRNWTTRFEDLHAKILNQRLSNKRIPKSITFYLTVIPKYRDQTLKLLKAKVGETLDLWANSSSVDSLVFTDTSNKDIRFLSMLKFRSLFFLQTGQWRQTLRSDCLILDLNPRNLTAWLFLILRYLVPSKRTLVWGHLHSRFPVRRFNRMLRICMRALADGTIIYTYSEYQKARRDLPKGAVFIAPNSVSTRDSQIRSDSGKRKVFLYSGRLVPEKKVSLLLKAYKQSGLYNNGISLVIIGDGPDMGELVRLSVKLDINESVKFLGEVFDLNSLAENYGRAIASVSPGYVGLSLTQSAGYGVPMILARNEFHSPEFEIIRKINHYFFEKDDYFALSIALQNVYARSETAEFELSCESMANFVRKYYSAETMAEGLYAAIYNTPQSLDAEGFPNEN
jgi:glycosyltransferase involved in cell wall biosynthesis